MYKFFITFLVLTFSLNALEIKFSLATQNSQQYSLLEIKNSKRFICDTFKDDFNNIKELICAFNEKPIVPIKRVSDDFFKLSTRIKGKQFFVIIQPKKKMKLFAENFDLLRDKVIFNTHTNISKSWVLVGYKEKLPFIQQVKQKPKDINFPVYFDESSYPSVGGLDLKGNPIEMQNVDDINEYTQIKKAYDDKDYENVLYKINDILKEYPNSIFKSEILYYKIHSLHELGNYDDVINLAKKFLKEYSSDEHVGEVLLDLAHAYSKSGLFIDADYFFDRLFNEHKGEDVAYQGMIYKGIQYVQSGDNKKARKYFKSALYNTANIEIASRAAFELAKMNIVKLHFAQAELLFKKIEESNDKFFYNNYKESIKIFQKQQDNLKYKYAANMAGRILKYLPKKDENYEKLLRDYGFALANAHEDKKAVEVFNRYLKEFKYGQYIDDIQEKKDSLFFENKDENLTTKIDKYNHLMLEYKGDSIADEALYRKAKLLLENKHYQEVLDMKEALLQLDEMKYKDIKTMIDQAAKALMRQALENQKCLRVLGLSDAYKVKLSNVWDDKIYICAIQIGNYVLAKETAANYIKVKELSKRLKWQYRYAHVLYKTAKYNEAIKVCKDVISMNAIQKNKKYDDIYRVLFDSAFILEDTKDMFSSIKAIEKKFGLDFKDIERYSKMVSLGLKLKDNNIILLYGKKVIALQKKTHTFTQSPFIDFTLYNVYKDEGKYSKALSALLNIENASLKKEDKSRLFYLIASTYQKLKNSKKAKEYYKKSIQADKNSAWANLSKETLDLL